MRIQVSASSQTKGLERGWKQRARLKRLRLAPFTRVRLLRHALPISLLILGKDITGDDSYCVTTLFQHCCSMNNRRCKSTTPPPHPTFCQRREVSVRLALFQTYRRITKDTKNEDWRKSLDVEFLRRFSLGFALVTSLRKNDKILF